MKKKFCTYYLRIALYYILGSKKKKVYIVWRL